MNTRVFTTNLEDAIAAFVVMAKRAGMGDDFMVFARPRRGVVIAFMSEAAFIAADAYGLISCRAQNITEADGVLERPVMFGFPEWQATATYPAPEVKM